MKKTISKTVFGLLFSLLLMAVYVLNTLFKDFDKLDIKED